MASQDRKMDFFYKKVRLYEKIIVTLQRKLTICTLMDTVYEKLLEQLRTMTPEEKEAEWEALKKYNFGPSMEEYALLVMDYLPTSILSSSVEYNTSIPQEKIESNNCYYLAA